MKLEAEPKQTELPSYRITCAFDSTAHHHPLHRLNLQACSLAFLVLFLALTPILPIGRKNSVKESLVSYNDDSGTLSMTQG